MLERLRRKRDGEPVDDDDEKIEQPKGWFT